MPIPKDFLNDFTDCFNDPRFIPFQSVEFRAIAPDLDRLQRQDIARLGLSFKLSLVADGHAFGYLRVAPFRNGHDKIFGAYHDFSCFRIQDIKTNDNQKFHDKHPGLGRETVRRCTYFAYTREYDFKKLVTSASLDGAATFWYHLGLKPIDNKKPQIDWSLTAGFSVEEINAWQERLRTEPDELWKLASTQIGRNVLSKDHSESEIDFNNMKQKNLAFAQLRL